ncbi:hypothetical protein JW872_01360 [Candidatus Babeliales bacterium]|nr:hypothetical protein [Candidatus Babeliales bacterium]
MTMRLIFLCYIGTCCGAPVSLLEQSAYCLGCTVTIPLTNAGAPDLSKLASYIYHLSDSNERARAIIVDEVRKRYGSMLAQIEQQWFPDDCSTSDCLASRWYHEKDVPACATRQYVYNYPNPTQDSLWFLLPHDEHDVALGNDANCADQTLRALKLLASYHAHDRGHRIRMFSCNVRTTMQAIHAFIQEEYEDGIAPLVCVTHRESSPLVQELAMTYSVDLYLHLGNGYNPEHGRGVPVLKIPYQEEQHRSWWSRALPTLLVGGVEKTATFVSKQVLLAARTPQGYTRIMTAARSVGGDVVMNGLHQTTRLGAYLMKNPALGHYAYAAAVIVPLAWDAYKAYSNDSGAIEAGSNRYCHSGGITLQMSVLNRESTYAELPKMIKALPYIMRDIIEHFQFHVVRGGTFCVDINEAYDPPYVIMLAPQQMLHVPDYPVVLWPSQIFYDHRDSAGCYDQEVGESTRQSELLVRRYAVIVPK